jgi:predicted DNA-binding transcriptional regulator AlpA
MVDVDDLIDAAGFAALLGLSHRNSIRTYRKRYHDFPEPVVNLGSGRCLLWVRSEAEAYAQSKGRQPAQGWRRSG